MILNERQYRITRAAVADFTTRVRELSLGLDGAKLSAEQRAELVEAARAQLGELEGQISEYEALRAGAIQIAPITRVEELPLALIKARIARGWTQAELAERLGTSEQQVQRDEATRYRGASLDRLRSIADGLGVRLTGGASLPAPDKARLEADPRWRKPLLVILLQFVSDLHGRGVEGGLELQKLVLILEERLRKDFRWSVFAFEPYLYGGYDHRLEDDLDFLAEHGFVVKHVRAAKRKEADPLAKTRNVGVEPGPRAKKWIERFLVDGRLAPPEKKLALLESVREVAREYGGLGPTKLLEQTYAHFPEYSKRSVIHAAVGRRLRQRKGQR